MEFLASDFVFFQRPIFLASVLKHRFNTRYIYIWLEKKTEKAVEYVTVGRSAKVERVFRLGQIFVSNAPR